MKKELLTKILAAVLAVILVLLLLKFWIAKEIEQYLSSPPMPPPRELKGIKYFEEHPEKKDEPVTKLEPLVVKKVSLKPRMIHAIGKIEKRGDHFVVVVELYKDEVAQMQACSGVELFLPTANYTTLHAKAVLIDETTCSFELTDGNPSVKEGSSLPVRIRLR